MHGRWRHPIPRHSLLLPHPTHLNNPSPAESRHSIPIPAFLHSSSTTIGRRPPVLRHPHLHLHHLSSFSASHLLQDQACKTPRSRPHCHPHHRPPPPPRPSPPPCFPPPLHPLRPTHPSPPRLRPSQRRVRFPHRQINSQDPRAQLRLPTLLLCRPISHLRLRRPHVPSPLRPLLALHEEALHVRAPGGRTLEQMQTVRREEVWRVLRLLLSKKSEKAEAVDVGKELSTMANNMISRMATSRICSDGERDAEEVQKLVREAMLLAGSFNLSDYIGFCRNLDLQGLKKRYVEARRRSGEKMERILKEHEEKKKKKRSKGDDGVKDILDILVGISEDENAEMQLTRENIKAFVMIQQINVFIGSHLAY